MRGKIKINYNCNKFPENFLPSLASRNKNFFSVTTTYEDAVNNIIMNNKKSLKRKV